MQPPSLDAIAEARLWLADHIVRTPVWQWRDGSVAKHLGGTPATQVFIKLELLQHAGSFKTRGALLNLRALPAEARARGVTAVSAGNHAIAVSWSAAAFQTSAKVVMPKTADPFRVARCEELGAEVVLTDDVHAAFDTVRRIEADEGRSFIHPFEGPLAALGTATLGAEICEDVPELDAVIVPVGGGGLCAGIAAAVKQMQPSCQVFGVEPTGADSMSRSLAAGHPVAIDRVQTIADSLGAPRAEPYSFALCQQYLDEMVRIEDSALAQAMARMFFDLKLAVEPAAAASTAALFGPLRERLRGKRVALIACGTNIGSERYTALLNTSTAAATKSL